MKNSILPLTTIRAVALAAAVCGIAGGSASAADAQSIKPSDLPMVHRLNGGAAAKIMDLAEAKAATAAPSAIVIVDTSGSPLLVKRMEGASPSTFEVALGKARTAAAFGRKSATLEDATNGGRSALISSGFVVMQGGVPLTVGADIIGAIGVSGGTKDQDEAAAEAGAAALAQK